ncbi:MAG TPA: homoserine kinase [Bacteroidota bacterium]|nr:homoserine kinase [Bacteroidota bacterium]
MITVQVPCSTSNIGPGFDTLGLALNRYLLVTASPTEVQGAPVITIEGNGRDHIATDESNLVYKSMKTFARSTGKTLPAFSLHIANGVPAFGGLGSSGAAIAGGVFLANELLGTRKTRDELLEVAVKIEGHPDNVSAAIKGGFTINCYERGALRCRSIKITQALSVVACSPHFQLLTSQARQILPQSVTLKEAVTNIENVSSLVAALICGDFSALRYATADCLHEQYRATLIPGFAQVRQSALAAGALSCNISGAGPTVFCFATSNEEAIGQAMSREFAVHGLSSTVEVMSVENDGAVRLS